VGPTATTPGVQAVEPTATASSAITAKVRAEAVEPGATQSTTTAASKTAPPPFASPSSTMGRNISEKVAVFETTTTTTNGPPTAVVKKETPAAAVTKDVVDTEKGAVSVADTEKSTVSLAKSSEFSEPFKEEGEPAVQVVDHGMIQPPTFEHYTTVKDKDKEKGGEEEGLAIAIAVDEKRDVVAAEEYEEMEKLPFYKRKIFWGLLLLLVVAAVAIGVGVFSASDEEDAPPVILNGTLMPTPSPTSAPTGNVERLFREALFDEVDFPLGSPTSLTSRAFFRAADWFYADGEFDRISVPQDGFNATGSQGIQRFVLAWFYYHTTDLGNNPWLSCNPPRAVRNETDTCDFLDTSSIFALDDSSGVEICYFVAESTRWLTATPECEWAAVFCNDDGVVEALEVNAMGLSGSFPPFLHLFPELFELQLQYGALTGSIPTEVGLLSNLIALDLQGNIFNDPLPETLFDMPLVRLNVGWNAFNGTLPSGIGRLPSIEGLFINDSPITGPLPPELGNATSLQFFYMYGNNLAGESLPEAWGKSIALAARREPIPAVAHFYDFSQQVTL
jgi:hypothetical protein